MVMLFKLFDITYLQKNQRNQINPQLLNENITSL